VKGITLPCGRLIFCTLVLGCYKLLPRRESDFFFDARFKCYPLLPITIVMLDVLLNMFKYCRVVRMCDYTRGWDW
jgi:hypothetical protein